MYLTHLGMAPLSRAPGSVYLRWLVATSGHELSPDSVNVALTEHWMYRPTQDHTCPFQGFASCNSIPVGFHQFSLVFYPPLKRVKVRLAAVIVGVFDAE